MSDPERIPYFGRSWYRRGPGYWARRVFLSFMCLVVLTLFALITWGLVRAIAVDRALPLWGRAVVLAVVAAAVGWSSVTAWRAMDVVSRARRRELAVTLAAAAGKPRRGDVRGRRRVSAAALGGGVLLVISVPFCVGWGVVVALTSFQRYASPAEYAAWQRLERGGT